MTDHAPDRSFIVSRNCSDINTNRLNRNARLRLNRGLGRRQRGGAVSYRTPATGDYPQSGSVRREYR